MRSSKFQVFLLRWLGNFLVLSSFAGIILTFAPAVKAEVVYRVNTVRGVTYTVAGDSQADLSPAVEEKPLINLLAGPEPKPLEMTPISPDFNIIIPKIGANAKVVHNVDQGNYNEYIKALKTGVAHAKGTVLPGEVGNTFLFAHSVGSFWEINRWNAVFYLLKELKAGDSVDLFYLGRRFTYVVYDSKVVNPDETQYLSTVANFPMLTLQTCWPPGTTLKRLLVFARLSK